MFVDALTRTCDTCIVDEDIEPAELCHYVLDEAFGSRRFPPVAFF
jgi:hypothetical protein